MPATNYTPIQLYRTNTASTTAPSAGNLNAGELAINYNDGGMILFAKNTTGNVIKLMNNPANLLYPTTDGTAGQPIKTDGSGTLTFGTLGVSGGGTGATTLTANNVILGNGTSAVQFVAPGTTGNVLTSNGTTWISSAGAVGNVTTSGNNAFTGANTFYNATGQTFGTATAAQDGIILAGRAGGTSTYRVTLQPTTLSANRTLTLPNVTDTVATIGTAQTFTAAQTFRAANAIRSEAASTQDAVVIAGRAGGTSSYAVTLTPTTLSASRTVTLPDADINFTTGLGVAQGGTGAATLTANNVILGNGTSAVQFVAPGTAGNVLVSDGTTWTSAASSGGLTLIATLSPTSGTSSITASSIAAYKVLYLVASPLSFSAQDNLVAYFSADNGSTYPNNILLSASGTAPNGILTIFGANLSVTKTMLQQQSSISGQTLGGYITQVGPSAPINNIKVQLNSSTFSGSSNRIYIYGLN